MIHNPVKIGDILIISIVVLVGSMVRVGAKYSILVPSTSTIIAKDFHV